MASIEAHSSAPGLLGHSWGTVLALEFALRNPTRVSHLVLMNPAPEATLVAIQSADTSPTSKAGLRCAAR